MVLNTHSLLQQGAWTLWCLWNMAASEGHIWRWKAPRRGWSNTWQSHLPAPQWGPSAWLLPRMQSRGRGSGTARSSLPCKTGGPLNYQRGQNVSTVKLSHSTSAFFSVCFHLRCIQDPQLVVNVSRTMSVQFTPPELSEDCLYLNVYTPAEATTGDKVPVG